jgi:hypothetical protein
MYQASGFNSVLEDPALERMAHIEGKNDPPLSGID